MPYSDPAPDVFGRVHVGVVYTGDSKVAEHGGGDPAEPRSADPRLRTRHRPPRLVRRMVETTQVAPTILPLVDLDPCSLQAVQQEGTQILPGLR